MTVQVNPKTPIGPARRSPFLLVFAPIPGLGHWVVGRGGRGLLTFMVFAAGLNVVLMSIVIAPRASLSATWGWAIAGAAVLWSVVDVCRIVLGRRR